MKMTHTRTKTPPPTAPPMIAPMSLSAAPPPPPPVSVTSRVGVWVTTKPAGSRALALLAEARMGASLAPSASADERKVDAMLTTMRTEAEVIVRLIALGETSALVAKLATIASRTLGV